MNQPDPNYRDLSLNLLKAMKMDALPLTEMQDARHLAFCMRLARAHATMVRSLDHSLGEQFGISFADFQMMFHLERAPQGRLRRIDLAECLTLSASGVTRALLPLEKIGVVVRKSDPRDARVSFTALSPAGQTLLKNAENFLQPICADLFQKEANTDLGMYFHSMPTLALSKFEPKRETI